MMSSIHAPVQGPDSEYNFPDIRWTVDTDYLFNEDVLPTLPKQSKRDSNARILGRMLKQKFIHRISMSDLHFGTFLFSSL